MISMQVLGGVYDCLSTLFSASMKALVFLLLLLLSLSRCSQMRWLMEMHLDCDSQLMAIR